MEQEYHIDINLPQNMAIISSCSENKKIKLFNDQKQFVSEAAQRTISYHDIVDRGRSFVEEEILYAICLRLRELRLETMTVKPKHWWWMPKKADLSMYVTEESVYDLFNYVIQNIYNQWHYQSYNNSEHILQQLQRIRTMYKKDFLYIDDLTIENSFYNNGSWNSSFHPHNLLWHDLQILALYGIFPIAFEPRSDLDYDACESYLPRIMHDLARIRTHKTKRYRNKTVLVTYYTLHPPTMVQSRYGHLMFVTSQKSPQNVAAILRKTIFLAPSDQLLVV